MVSGGVFGARGKGKDGRAWLGSDLSRGALRFRGEPESERPVAFGNGAAQHDDYDKGLPTTTSRRLMRGMHARAGSGRVVSE